MKFPQLFDIIKFFLPPTKVPQGIFQAIEFLKIKAKNKSIVQM